MLISKLAICQHQRYRVECSRTQQNGTICFAVHAILHIRAETHCALLLELPDGGSRAEKRGQIGGGGSCCVCITALPLLLGFLTNSRKVHCLMDSLAFVLYFNSSIRRRVQMNYGEFAADFIAKNISKILEISSIGYKKADEIVQVALRTAYTEYLERTSEKYSKSKSFFIRSQSVDLYSYYVSSGVESGKKIIGDPDFKRINDQSKRVVLIGGGGSGKSVLMRHLFLSCIADGEFVPILIELRDLDHGAKLESQINKTLENFGFNTSGDYVRRAKKAGHFCFFFDGFDEVPPEHRKKLSSQIEELSNRFPDCPIFISSRPDDEFSGKDDFALYKISPLKLASATNLVQKLPFDQEIKAKFIADLKGGLFSTHESFLSNPLLLSIMLLTYGENAEIPTKLSIFYNQAYEALFQRHDANKGGYSRKRLTSLDIQDFSRVFALFSLLTYERKTLKMSRMQCLMYIENSRKLLQKDFVAESYLVDLMSAACLMIEDGLEIAFSHRSFQEYFVAVQIASSQPEIQRKLISRYWHLLRSDNVMQLLLEINPDLVERELFIPVLEKLFSDLGVKNEVGITHYLKFVKLGYRKFDVTQDTVYASVPSQTAAAIDVMKLLVKHSGYQLDPDRLKSSRDGFLRFCVGHAEVSFFTKNLTRNDEFFLQLKDSYGVFSMEYLKIGWANFKKTRNKHEKSVAALENLLGIQ